MRLLGRTAPRLAAAIGAGAVTVTAALTLTAGPSAATTGPDCTFTDTTNPASADSLTNPVLTVTTGDSVTVACTGLAATTGYAMSEATPGAGLVTGQMSGPMRGQS